MPLTQIFIDSEDNQRIKRHMERLKYTSKHDFYRHLITSALDKMDTMEKEELEVE